MVELWGMKFIILRVCRVYTLNDTWILSTEDNIALT